MFIILAHQRSGTHLLATLLNSHPDIRCYDEILIRENIPHRNEMLGEKELTELGENEGAIVMYNQFLLASDKEKETVANAKIIHLVRDAEDRARSNLRVDRAKVEGMRGMRVHSFDGEDITVFPLKDKEVQERIEDIERIEKATLKELPEDLDLYGIAYEEITHDRSVEKWPEKEARELLKFLEIEPRTLTTNLRKPKYVNMFDDIDGTFKNKQIREFLKHDFDFDNQHKDTYDDWIGAFEKAVERNSEGKCFIGLSSGYDSGTLSWELQKQKADFKAYIIPRGENADVLKERAQMIESSELAVIMDKDVVEIREFLENNIENARYVIKKNGVRTQQRILDDEASWGLALTCKLAKSDGYDTYISTQGADEIIADYGLWESQSTFNGTFPESLHEWDNFKRGCNWSYMMKEERIPEPFDADVRFPFLDIGLVQEFLWLTPELKNRYYKAPLHIYLTRNEVPFEEGVKRGFGLY